MIYRQTLIALLLVSLHTSASSGEDLLLHWNFDEDQAGRAGDLSGNGLDGIVNAQSVDSPSGKAAMMDGTPRGIVSVDVPEGKRFGKRSWTFMAMLRPQQFHIDDEQNQRRIFAFGQYPAAYLVIDINGDGQVSGYFCYQDKNGEIISAGGTSGLRLTEKHWGHVALVCDRDNRQIQMYVNGYSSRTVRLPDEFDGDFRLDGPLTVGSSWHNFWGTVDEVKIYRRALSSQAVEAEFDRLKPTFGVIESEEVLAAKRRARLSRVLDAVRVAWTRRDFTQVRTMCRNIVEATDCPSHFRSYAHLRIAQSHVAQQDMAEAKSVYQAIAAEASYPAVHRYEAGQSVKELARLAEGRSPRDPLATHTKLPNSSSFAAEVFVSPSGNDSAAGSAQQPFATLQQARDKVRGLKGRGVGGPIAITVMPGRYPMRETLELSSQDSGTAEAPIVYRAQRPSAAVFYGGRPLRQFQPVTDDAVLQRLPAESRGKVWQCDLKSHGIDDFGQLKVRGFAQPPPPPTVELYINRVPMKLARWPNQGFVGIDKLIEPGSKQTGQPSVFQYQSDRHARWIDAQDAWLFGYFRFLWADATIKIGKIDTATKTLTTDRPYHYGGRGMSTEQGIQYYAFNLLEEIDSPGEWYLDRPSGMLYVYPPAGVDKARAEIGVLSEPMVKMDQVSHVRFEGLVFDLARYNGVEARNCKHCWLVGCTISRLAGNGVMIHGGKQNRLIGCDIHTIGRRATEIIGGDRATLTPGGHVVENCRIHHFGRIDRTYTPAIQLEGVGHRVAHNLMYNGPSSAMRIEGNDHLIELNEVHSMVQESDDQGAMELYGNPTYRGVVFRHNYLHHIGKTGSEIAVHGQAALRFDDAISGMLVYGNVFYRSAGGNFGAIQMNSGRDNVIDNNLFMDCKQGISGGWYENNNIWKMLRDGQKPASFFTTPPYMARYPKLATMLDDPGINHVWRNVFYRCGTMATRARNLDLMANAAIGHPDAGLAETASGNSRVDPNADIFESLGFKPIPQEQIGLYQSPARASWPVETTPAD